MNFRLFLENEIKELPIKSLIMTKSELFEAVSNIVRGYPAMTEGPVEVAYLSKFKKYQLINGYHRMIDHLLRGETFVKANIQEGNWNLPKDKFIYKPDLQYKGLEDFIEPYLLKKL